MSALGRQTLSTAGACPNPPPPHPPGHCRCRHSCRACWLLPPWHAGPPRTPLPPPTSWRPSRPWWRRAWRRPNWKAWGRGVCWSASRWLWSTWARGSRCKGWQVRRGGLHGRCRVPVLQQQLFGAGGAPPAQSPAAPSTSHLPATRGQTLLPLAGPPTALPDAPPPRRRRRGVARRAAPLPAGGAGSRGGQPGVVLGTSSSSSV